ncbi:hypothetical protein Back11_05600 [Paenibacillus baekrokdamisoli]|uniref:Uncharacterized protein n=1 Tax=Paenibacillus baekrokdamisoli TaxID=1712516 RepID=A0A3G9IT50_9BACL|nr:hypothetical protein [Paenibacillus baekrokdamisoli]MBB3067599.1 uncharacterized BrkB/YihY/UPF0761 family membrane protein [Paenibacillus baekrokdamisoli]BBH19215.1 hypothetical protein Back11_05600 [Paenibacillus baekrokdamisoli]
MLFFERVRKLSNVCIVIFVLFFILMIVSFSNSKFSEILQHNFTNDLRGTIFTLISFIISIFSLTLGISLKYIVKDANEEIKLLEERTKKNSGEQI